MCQSKICRESIRKLVSLAFIRYNMSTAQYVSCAIGCSSLKHNVKGSLLVFRKHKTGFLAPMLSVFPEEVL
jgi:hypothetical protein